MWKTGCNWSCLVTIGDQATVETQKPFEASDLTRYLYLHGLSVETTESLAEYAYKQAQPPLGIGSAHSARVTDLFHQKYRGSRYSFGYSVCPNLRNQAKIFKLREPETSIGVRLTEGTIWNRNKYKCNPGASSKGKLLFA
jgi:5-methyltetrahydrofolate--homocysteine methyltransferase